MVDQGSAVGAIQQLILNLTLALTLPPTPTRTQSWPEAVQTRDRAAFDLFSPFPSCGTRKMNCGPQFLLAPIVSYTA